MISFRFHVVSITAIFLAIAIGVVVGSTYVDGAVVDGLRNRIDSVSQNLDERKAENDRLEVDLDAARRYIDGSADFAVTDRLADEPVLVVAARGVDEASVEQIALLSRQAGGVVAGVVWLEPRWGLQDGDDRASLAEIVGGNADDAAEDLWSAAWDAAVEELTADEPAEDPSATSPTTVPGATDPAPTTTDQPARTTDVLGPLEAGGFLSIESLNDASVSATDLGGTNPAAILLTGSRARDELEPMLPIVVEATTEAGMPIVVGDVHVQAPEAAGRGELLTATFSQELRDVIVLVDDADLPEGHVATVLALDGAIDGLVGLHFGVGDGADGLLPRWTPL